MDDTPPVCDYEGSDYRTRFWEGQGRSYEDQVERVALRRLMPPAGQTLIEIGAGFGRLADEYRGYRQVVLFDYSRSLLREAQTQLPQLAAPDTEFIFVAGNWYKMPFVAGLFDTMVQVRTLHHAADVVTHGVALGVLAGATAGDPYFLAGAGGLTTTAPAVNSDRVLIGHAINATDLNVNVVFLGAVSRP